MLRKTTYTEPEYNLPEPEYNLPEHEYNLPEPLISVLLLTWPSTGWSKVNDIQGVQNSDVIIIHKCWNIDR